MIRPFQLGKINVLAWNISHRRIRRFAERQGIAGIGNHTARNGYDDATGIALDGDRVIWTCNYYLFFLHVLFSVWNSSDC